MRLRGRPSWRDLLPQGLGGLRGGDVDNEDNEDDVTRLVVALRVEGTGPRAARAR
jgi:hypothetical protein